MSKKQVSLFILLAVVTLPLLAGAEDAKAKIKERLPLRGQAARPLASSTRENRERGTSTRATTTRATSTRATSTEARKDAQIARVQDFIGKAGNKLTREIALVKNIINRLTGTGSIVAKLDTRGVNTTAIKNKLAEASTLITKAETELTAIKNATASSTPAIKARMISTRKIFVDTNSDIKLAITKIKEARRLIAQVPSLKNIEQQTGATSTSATGTAATTSSSTTSH